MKLNDINLLKVKSIITLLIIGTFVYLAVTKQIDAKDVFVVVGMVVTYFFNKKDEPKEVK